MNKFIISGYVAKNPDLKCTTSGTNLTSISRIKSVEKT